MLMPKECESMSLGFWLELGEGEFRQCVRVMQVQRELVRDTGGTSHSKRAEGSGRGVRLCCPLQVVKPPLPPCKGRELGHIRA